MYNNESVLCYYSMIELEVKISVKRDGEEFLNPLKTALLVEVIHTGSLSAAAKRLRLSYQHSWNLVREMNGIASEPMVITKRGGSNGGGAELSAYGLKILNEYRSICKAVQHTVDQVNAEINM